MDALKDIWEKSKGKIATAALTFLFGLGVVAGTVGLKAVDCPEESGLDVCLVISEAPTE